MNAFGGQIASAVEDNISKKVREGIVKLDSSLQSLPKQIELDDIAALNVTLVDNPVLSNSSIQFQINGLFTAPIDDSASSLDHKGSLDPLLCNAPAKMVEISLHENVFHSVSLLFFNVSSHLTAQFFFPLQKILKNGHSFGHFSPLFAYCCF